MSAGDVRTDVLVIGAGMSGLTAAVVLQRAGVSCLVAERSDRVGGRVATDRIDGVLVDRGFQVLLDSYSEVRALLDLDALDLRRFEPGARVWFDGAFHTLMDPWRRPGSIIDGALARVGTLGDKLRVGSMRSELGALSEEALFGADRPERPALEALRARGFSEGMIERFFRPFFGGIFLDPALGASSRMMEFVFRSFARGDACVPREGMGGIPAQLAARLEPGSVLLRSGVACVEPAEGRFRVRLTTGRCVEARACIAAAPGAVIEGLPAMERRLGWRGVVNVVLVGEGEPPSAGRAPVLLLDGEGRWAAANVAFMSSVSPAYAPPERFVVSCSCLGEQPTDDATLVGRVREQLVRWFGPGAEGWTPVAVRRIDRALPDQRPPWYTRRDWPVRVARGLYRAGDTADTASIDGAMRAGRRAAEAAIEDLGAGG
jgi:phytoene dehydrogenase-like protein